MDSVGRVLAEGDAVFLTVLGMGCVFLALTALDLFMSFMDRIVAALALAVRLPQKVGERLLSRSGADATERVPGTGTAPPVAVTPEAGRSAEPIRDGVEERIAAAISIALALDQGARAAAIPVAARAPTGGASPWKIGGRLRQLQRHPRR